MKDKESLENTIANLEAAGCNDKQIEHFTEYFQDHNLTKELQLLKYQRCYLLEELHDVQKKLDCLDYLIYMLKKDKK